jgi:hypothetical protein
LNLARLVLVGLFGAGALVACTVQVDEAERDRPNAQVTRAETRAWCQAYLDWWNAPTDTDAEDRAFDEFEERSETVTDPEAVEIVSEMDSVDSEPEFDLWVDRIDDFCGIVPTEEPS